MLASEARRRFIVDIARHRLKTDDPFRLTPAAPVTRRRAATWALEQKLLTGSMERPGLAPDTSFTITGFTSKGTAAFAEALRDVLAYQAERDDFNQKVKPLNDQLAEAQKAYRDFMQGTVKPYVEHLSGYNTPVAVLPREKHHSCVTPLLLRESIDALRAHGKTILKLARRVANAASVRDAAQTLWEARWKQRDDVVISSSEALRRLAPPA